MDRLGCCTLKADQEANMNAVVVKAGLAVFVTSLVLAGCNRTDAIDDGAVATAPGIDNDRVETYVRARFQADDAIRASDIDVSALNGRVTLSGTVPSEEARQHAIRVAGEASGVQSVDDRLVVSNAGGAAASADAAAPSATSSRPVAAADAPPTASGVDRTRDPGWITTKIQAQYFADPEISPWNIDVSTNAAGVVTLSGNVDEAGDRDEAVRIARATEGVTRVDDRITMAAAGAGSPAADRADGDEPDAWVTAKIQAKYFMDAEVKGRDIDVDTSNGTVTLRGEVSSDAERRQAIAIARNTEGVRDVNDQLTLNRAAETGDSQTGLARASGAVDDAWITTKILSKFYLDRDIKGSVINVNTSNGVVTLDGGVDSAAEREAAEQIARETEGVSRVNNQLRLTTTR
jgi:osmotically-inducible protein OsmY